MWKLIAAKLLGTTWLLHLNVFLDPLDPFVLLRAKALPRGVAEAVLWLSVSAGAKGGWTGDFKGAGYKERKTTEEMTEHLELTIDQLLLDQENPRLGSTASQSEALAGLVLLNPGHFRNLMGSIRDEGLDPGDSLYVIRSEDEHDDFLVLEGNRRLSALKVLSNPDVLAGTGLADTVTKPLVREVTGFDRTKVEPIRCVRFDDREEANEWIRRRHTGVADGEGRITWKPLDIQRFSNDYTTVDVIEFVGRNAGYSKEEWDKAHSAVGGGKSTNLTRLLESAAGRRHLGISVRTEVGRKTPMLGSEPKWTLAVLRRIVDDILSGGVDSRQLNRATDIEKYFAELPPELQPSEVSVVAKPKAFRDISLTGSRQAPPQKPRTRKRPAPRRRTMLAPKTHPFDMSSSTKLGMLVGEAGSLNIERLPLSAAFVLRAVVELAVNDYMKANNLPLEPPGGGREFDLTKKTTDVVDDLKLKNKVRPTDLRAFRNRMLTKTSACSIQSLNGFVHNRYDLPSPADLRAGWEALLPLLVATYGSA